MRLCQVNRLIGGVAPANRTQRQVLSCHRGRQDLRRQEIGQALDVLETSCLVLEQSRLMANPARLKRHLHRLHPHLTTATSIDVARLVMDGAQGPVTVSTLKEAEYFFSHSVSDLHYAVSIAPNKLDHVFDLRRRRADLAPGRVQQRTLVQNQNIIWNSIYE